MANTTAVTARRAYLLAVYECDVRGHVRCWRCGTLLDAHSMTVDRIFPASAGGTYYRSNCRPACAKCNVTVGDRSKNHAKLISAANYEASLEGLREKK